MSRVTLRVASRHRSPLDPRDPTRIVSCSMVAGGVGHKPVVRHGKPVVCP